MSTGNATTCGSKPSVVYITDGEERHYYTVYKGDCKDNTIIDKQYYINVTTVLLNSLYDSMYEILNIIIDDPNTNTLLKARIDMVINILNLNSGLVIPDIDDNNIILLRVIDGLISKIDENSSEMTVDNLTRVCINMYSLLTNYENILYKSVQNSISNLCTILTSLMSCNNNTKYLLSIKDKPYTVFKGYCVYKQNQDTANVNKNDTKYLKEARSKIYFITGCYKIYNDIYSIISTSKSKTRIYVPQIIKQTINTLCLQKYDIPIISSELKKCMILLNIIDPLPIINSDTIKNIQLGLQLIQISEYTKLPFPIQEGIKKGGSLRKPKVVYKTKERIVHQDKYNEKYIVFNKEKLYLRTIKGQYKYQKKLPTKST